MEPTVVVDLRHQDGSPAGHLQLWAATAATRAIPDLIREASEYRYLVDAIGEQAVHIEPDDLFDEDPRQAGSRVDARLTGRLRTRNYVGTLELVVELAGGSRVLGLLEIHSTKLDYDSQYRWMLSGLAEEGAALLLRSFAPTSVPLAGDLGADASTLYQQVAFLAAILRRPHTIEAFERVFRSPHVSYVDTAVEYPVGRGVPGSSAAVRATFRPGARIPVREGLTVASLPKRVLSGRPQATVDNPPNQLVRFVLEQWAAVLGQVRAVLKGDTPDDRRGRREVTELLDLVDSLRTDRRLQDVGSLREWPTGNQVVLRRPGYREIHQAFLESRAAAILRWDGAVDVHNAGQRDVAQLYEYWCYLELRRLVERLCHHSDSSPLVELTHDGMHLVLRRGTQRVVSGFLTRLGRPIDVELWFNRSFSSRDESWSLQMRPDCSLKFTAQAGSGADIETWVHFDAKYRVDSTRDLFIDDDASGDDDIRRAARRVDLLKMHAYRDAIRGSAGAYILFPGGDRKVLRQYYELLPGLGAFPFVPGSDGHATPESSNEVLAFLDDLIDHIAEQASNRERADYWTRLAHADRSHLPTHQFVLLDRPPADTTVLLGYYRSPAHLMWIEANRLYNMRFGARPGAVQRTGREAAAELLVLWSDAEEPARIWWMEPGLHLLDDSDLRARGYPREPSGTYLCRELGQRMQNPPIVSGQRIGALTTGRRFGEPMATTWVDILRVLAIERGTQ